MLDQQMSAVATGSHTNSAQHGQFSGHPIGQNALQAKDNDAAFLGKSRLVGVIDPENSEARYTRQTTQCLCGQSLFFILNYIKADPL